MHSEGVRSRAKRGLIPGAKTGRRWVFIDIDLAPHIGERSIVGAGTGLFEAVGRLVLGSADGC